MQEIEQTKEPTKMKELGNIPKVFVLDGRGILTSVEDVVMYQEDGKIHCRKVFGVRCVDGNYEVKVLGQNSGWKRGFLKLAND